MKKSNAKVDALALISFPHQILHALAAIRFDSEKAGAIAPSTNVFFLWSHQASNHRAGSSFSEFAIRALASEGTVILPNYLARATTFSPYRTIKARASSIARSFPAASSFFFSHDQSADHTAQAFLQSGLADNVVCFGDPPGFFYPSEWRPPWKGDGIATTLKNALWRTRLRGLDSWATFDVAAAAISAGHRAESVQRIPRRYFIEILRDLNVRFPEIAACSASILGAKSLLLITSNFYESGLMTRENESRLYSEIARTSIEHGETLVIRPHPGATAVSIKMLKSALAGMAVRFFPDTLRHYPIELFAPGFEGSRVSSVSSSVAMLRFLYNADVECSLTEDRVERYFKPEYREYGHAMVHAFRSQPFIGDEG